MSPHFHHDVLSKVRYSIEIVRQKRRSGLRESDYLVKMNIAPLQGRRDAAYDCVVDLISEHLLNAPDFKRHDIYQYCLNCLAKALDDSRDILLALDDEEICKREERFILFLQLLFNFVQVADNLVNYELSFYSNIDERNKFLKHFKNDALQQMDLVINESEAEITESAHKLLQIIKGPMKRLREQLRNKLPRKEQTKYKKAFSTYQEMFTKDIEEFLQK